MIAPAFPPVVRRCLPAVAQHVAAALDRMAEGDWAADPILLAVLADRLRGGPRHSDRGAAA